MYDDTPLPHPSRRVDRGIDTRTHEGIGEADARRVFRLVSRRRDDAAPPARRGVGGGGVGEGAAVVSAVARDLRRFAELRSDVIVGTPGRVEDVLTRYDDVDVSELEVLILDESDVLLDMGFEVTLTSILGRLPRMRRTGLFSATNTSGVRRLCVRSGMRNPVVVDVAISSGGPVAPPPRSSSSRTGKNDDGSRDEEVEETGDDAKQGDNHDDVVGSHDDTKQRQRQPQQQATPSSLTNYYLICPLDEKLSRLVSFISQHPSDKVIVFFLTCACVEYYGSVLRRLRPPCLGYEYVALHGKLAQRKRERAMEAFRGGDREIDAVVDDGGKGTTARSSSAPASSTAGRALLCTDVASRGLDVPDVSWTVQFDAPIDPSSYVHRVGRSARAGKEGKSLVFLSRKEEAYVDFLRLRKVPVGELPDTEVCKPPSIMKEEEEEEEEEGANGDEREITDDDGNDVGGGLDGEDLMDVTEADDEPPEMPARTNSVSRSSPGTAKRMIKSAAGRDIFVPDLLPSILKLTLKDRDILEKGTKAFTSYIRAYKEHHCSFIFRFASLDLGLLATSFSLLRLPKMPELRDKKLLNFVPAGPEVNIHAIPFKDKARESARQKRLAAELAAGGKNAKQIKAEQRAAERIARSKERRAAEIAKGRNPHKKKGKQARIFDEWDELAREERLYKKLRTKKISKEEYDRLMYGDGSGGGNDESSGGGSD
ncbi:hypothetical protein ACHAXA_000316 [Cyclostephanos tholiformis]|uniref:ATP-dependent RNA helicase n=1 Tax=Cyclostephanos tholiformis TaxID=382380 RepID=A0ABD3R3W0_9STRA